MISNMYIVIIVYSYHGSLQRMSGLLGLFVRQKNEEAVYGKVTAVTDPEVRPKCPHFLGFIFLSNMFTHSEKH